MITTDLMINSLDELEGPVEGFITVPVVVSWTPKKEFDISNKASVKVLYRDIIANATNSHELKKINKDILLKIWKELRQDYRIKARWEAKFPELKG